VEERVYDMAPDLVSLEIIGQEVEPASGFVSLESLLKHPASVPALAVQGTEVEGAD
jgi:hypothetical protein